MDENTAHNNIVLQYEEDPVSPAIRMGNFSLEAASKHVTPNEPNNRKPVKFVKAVKFGSLLQRAAAELIGTFFIVFVGGILCAGGASRGDIIWHASAALSGGLVVMIMIFSTAHISGAHLNPAVTLGFAIAGLFSWTQVVPYILSQIIGSLLASIILQVLLHDVTLLSLVINQPLHHDFESLIIECVATFLLMVVNIKVACNLGQTGELGGIFMIGITVALLGFSAGTLGVSLSMNPARSIGPALVMRRFNYLHIFILGPILGATLSGLIYGMICPSILDGKSLSTNQK